MIYFIAFLTCAKQIVSQMGASGLQLSGRARVAWYIQLVIDLLGTTIRYAQSMVCTFDISLCLSAVHVASCLCGQPRPLLPNACFKTSTKWRRLCQATINAFSDGSIVWNPGKSTKSVQAQDGKKKSLYVADPKRYALYTSGTVILLSAFFLLFETQDLSKLT